MEDLKKELESLKLKLDKAEEKFYEAIEAERTDTVINALQKNLDRLHEKEDVLHGRIHDLEKELRASERVVPPTAEEDSSTDESEYSSESEGDENLGAIPGFEGIERSSSATMSERNELLEVDNEDILNIMNVIEGNDSEAAKLSRKTALQKSSESNSTDSFFSMTDFDVGLSKLKKDSSTVSSGVVVERDDLSSYFNMIHRHPTARQYFNDFLKKSGVSEIYQCQSSISNFKRHPTVENAKQIYNNYLSTSMVDVSKTLLRDIRKAIINNQFEESLFDMIEDIVNDTIVGTHFKGFLSSKEFESLQVELQKQEKGKEKARAPVFEVIKGKKAKEFKNIMGSGVPLTLLNERGESLLFAAAESNSLAVAEYIMKDDEGRDLVNLKSFIGVTPLQVAARRGNNTIIEKLISWGAEVNSTDKMGNTALHSAAERNNIKAAEILMKSGAKSDIMNVDGKTPLDISKRKMKNIINQYQVNQMIVRSQTDQQFAQWSPNFSTNIELFDMEHKQLVHYLNALHDYVINKTQSGELEIILLALQDYTKYHFNHEEKYMILYNYPNYRSHRTQHRKFEEKVKSVVKSYTDGKVKFEKKLLVFIKEWVVNHILKVDMMYSEFFSDREILIE